MNRIEKTRRCVLLCACLVFCLMKGFAEGVETEDAQKREAVSRYRVMWAEIEDRVRQLSPNSLDSQGASPQVLDVLEAAHCCEIAEAVYAFYPDNGYVLFDLYWLYQQAARNEEAAEMLERAEQSAVPLVRLAACLERAYDYEQRGDDARAFDAYRRFLDAYRPFFTGEDDWASLPTGAEDLCDDSEDWHVSLDMRYRDALYSQAYLASELGESMECLRCTSEFLAIASATGEMSGAGVIALLQQEEAYRMIQFSSEVFEALEARLAESGQTLSPPLSEQTCAYMQMIAEALISED